MSNHLAIATVTAALRHKLHAALASLTGASATSLRPTSAAHAKLPTLGVNVFLYQTAVNATRSNDELPARRGDGEIVRRPALALDLYYLLSFYGDRAKQEPETAMGVCVRELQTQPILTRELLDQTLASAPHLDGSDLAAAVESVRMLPIVTASDEMWRLWSALSTPYVLSATYQASVVMIEADVSPRPPALPVRAFTTRIDPFRRPVITGVASLAPGETEPVAGQAILVGHKLALSGRGLLAATDTPVTDTTLRIGELELELELEASSSPTELRALLPEQLRAGPQLLELVHYRELGGIRRPATVAQAAFVLQPSASFARVDDDIVATITPAVDEGQQVALLLNQYAAAPGSVPATYTIPTLVPAPATELSFAIAGITAGEYLVRVQIDGAQSPLEFDEAEGRYAQPRVTIP